MTTISLGCNKTRFVNFEYKKSKVGMTSWKDCNKYVKTDVDSLI